MPETGLPPGVSFDSALRHYLRHGPRRCVDSHGPYVVTITGTDASSGASAKHDLPDWAVKPAGRVHLAEGPSNQSNFDGGDSVSLAISATDTASDAALTYTATGLPSGLSIDSSSGVISGTIASTADTDSPYTVAVTATDSTAGIGESQTFTWTVAQPTLLLSNPGGYDNIDGDSVSGNSLLEYDNATSHTVAFSASGLPSGLSIDSSSGAISGTIGSTADTDLPLFGDGHRHRRGRGPHCQPNVRLGGRSRGGHAQRGRSNQLHRRYRRFLRLRVRHPRQLLWAIPSPACP